MTLKNPQRACGPHSPDICPLALHWAFAMTLDLGGHHVLIQRNGFSDDELARELGLGEMIYQDEAFRPARALARLRRERQLFAKAFTAPDYPPLLGENLAALGSLLGLNAGEQRLLGFCVLLHGDPILSAAADQLGGMGMARMLQVLASLLDLDQEALLTSLSREGRLIRCGLLELKPKASVRVCLTDRLEVSNLELLGQLRFHRGSALELLRHSFRCTPPAQLHFEDYAYLGETLDIAERYLRKALDTGRPGVNVLIHGPSGTGKTQLSRVLTERLGATLYEVACSDEDGDPVRPTQRMSALRMAMSVLHRQQAMVVIDEVEDVFAQESPSGQVKGHKGWFNRMLEENPLPCFWLCNSIESLDTAYLRRFDLLIELENPPRAQRERIVRQCAGDRLGNLLVGRLADHENVTPAVVERAVRIGRCLTPRAGRRLDATVEHLVNATLSAQGFSSLEEAGNSVLPELYSLDYTNADVPLAGLLDGLRRHPDARLCFHGVPGTGKTALGHWIARSLDRPLLIKRASDLISPYVGETEQNLARAFAQARRDQAVLLLDEVDSFLQERRKALQSWEVSLVNEMLTQMENHRGVFIASTNLMDGLDSASLRRFDLKVRFDYLRAEQVTALFREHLRSLRLKDPDDRALARLQGIDNLTPGDFALATRQGHFQPLASADALVEVLLAEARLKSGSRRPIGFVQ